MNIKFKISKTANLFFFVDNLAEWNIYYRPKYNKEWKDKFGKLSKEETKSLTKYKELMQKYEPKGISKKIRNCFYQKKLDDENVVFKKIEKIITKNETRQIKNTFITLKPRFEKMWEQNKDILIYNKNISLREYKKIRKKLNISYKQLEYFFGNKSKKNYTCFVFFIISTNRGGKAINKDTISIEAERLNIKEKYRFTRLWFSIMHELTHARFENKKYKNWLKKILEKEKILELKPTFSKNRHMKEILREIITDLTKVFFYNLLDKKGIEQIEKVNKNKLDLHEVEIIIRKKLRPVVKTYIKNKKQIDISLVNKCIILIKNYL